MQETGPQRVPPCRPLHLNQNPMEIPSEPIQKRGFASTLSEALRGSPDFEFTIAEQATTHPKRQKKLNLGGGLY